MAAPIRQRPEDFLELVERSRRGKLKLYIGFAAGVGKTWRMLEEARALRRRGVDVVGALVETHGRAETTAQIGDLELVPRRRVEYRGVAVEEMDLDAVLARKPTVAIVDEIPHTNAPGSRNGKRWQDVVELLEAGVNVIGALNVQHLESLNDLIQRNTGVQVRETVPDSLLEQADQVVNLDLAVEDLLDRLKAGKIYPEDRIPWALEHFFRDANLSTLRELSLREVAQSLDRAAIRQPSATPSAPAPGRVMVCLSSNPPHAATLLRRGSRMAGRLNTDWYAVYVETSREAPERIDSEAQRHLHANIAKAKALGGEVVRLQSDDPAAALLDFARTHRVSDLVLGRGTDAGWRRLLRRSVLDRVLEGSEGLDVHVVSFDEGGGPMTLRRRLLLAQVPLAAALILVGAASLRTVAFLGESSETILKDNYRSVLAAQRMGDALDGLDREALLRALDREAVQEARALRERFDEELRVQEGNVTEPGEAEATARLRADWEAYRAAELAQSTSRDGIPAFLGPVQKASLGVRSAIDEVLVLNQDAMVRKSNQARRSAERLLQLMMVATAAALALGLVASFGLTARIVKPLSSLSLAVRRFGEGDVESRARPRGKDEIAALAIEFNTMADRLEEYRKSSLGDLIQAQQASQAAIDSLPDPVIILDVDGGVLNLNRAAEGLLHVGPGQGAGAHLHSLDPALRDSVDAIRTHVLAGKGAVVPRGFDEAVRIDLPDGPRRLLPRATALYSEEGAVTGITVVLQDVTRLVRFDELKNDLVATVAHEFRTPLTSLRMAIHMCAEEAAGPLTQAQADLMAAARQDCERLQAIVDDVLDLSRIQAGRIELHARSVDACALVDQAIKEIEGPARIAGVQAWAEASGGPVPVQVDPERIGVVLGNLLGNAVRHTPEGGTVVARLRTTDEGVRIEVEDTGEGIPAQYLDRVFDRFFQVPGSRRGGVGLGLYISREVVRAHGGEMGVASEAGKGSTFWFTLPARPRSAA